MVGIDGGGGWLIGNMVLISSIFWWRCEHEIHVPVDLIVK